MEGTVQDHIEPYRQWITTRGRTLWAASKQGRDYWLVRFVFLRLLGFVYLFAYLSLVFQLEPLLGSDGILPVERFLDLYGSQFSSDLAAFVDLPTVFWFSSSDAFMQALAWTGLILSVLLLIGFANVPMLLANWFIYLSFVNVGQLFYGYGWESQLVETGFLAVFLVPLWDPRPFSRIRPPVPIIWMLRWLTMRVYLGAGLIKLRGDQCWRTLDCLDYHFETQPIPNPISPYLHYMPDWVHTLGVLVNHFVEVIIPFFVTLGATLRRLGGVLLIGFQATLITSGNFSFLNWLTLTAAVSYLDDTFLARFMPQRLVQKAERAKQNATYSNYRHAIVLILVLVVAVLSVPVIINLLSPTQTMNTSFNNARLVNTYGAFGAVTKQRPELVIQGAQGTSPQDGDWETYDFRYKPDHVDDPLPVVAPYQPRMAWQLWFAAMSRPDREPWLARYIWMLLHNDPEALELVKENPFPDNPPEYIRILRYRYEFAPPGSNVTWHRSDREVWLPPISRSHPQLQQFGEW